MSLKLSDCLTEASAYWTTSTPASAKVMIIRAGVGVAILGAGLSASSLTQGHGARLLSAFTTRGLSRKSVADYYSTFKRMLFLSGVSPNVYSNWPKPPVPARHNREGLSTQEFARMAEWFHGRPEYQASWDLIQVLEATGLRVNREALNGGSLRFSPGDQYDTLEVTGKGGHQRVIPVVNPKARAILGDGPRLQALRAVPYQTHLWRWNQAKKACGITGGLATPHSLRHKYATEALDKSGGNLRLVQELLGHSNPGTTALYVKVDMQRKVEALTKDQPPNENPASLPERPAGP